MMLYNVLVFALVWIGIFVSFTVAYSYYIRHYFINQLVDAIWADVSEKQDELRKKSQELPIDENPLVSGNCKVENGLIVRKDDEAEDDEDQLREYFWG